MRIGLIGKKIGMTREFLDSGLSVPVTVLAVEKGRIINLITKDKRGYDAIQVGFGKIKNSKLKNQMKGFFLLSCLDTKHTIEKPYRCVYLLALSMSRYHFQSKFGPHQYLINLQYS